MACALAQGIPGVIAPDAKVELVQEGFVFLEGPVGAADGGLYFSDLQTADRTNRMDPSGKISPYREHTHGMNGLALTRDGALVGVEGEGKRDPCPSFDLLEIRGPDDVAFVRLGSALTRLVLHEPGDRKSTRLNSSHH